MALIVLLAVPAILGLLLVGSGRFVQPRDAQVAGLGAAVVTLAAAVWAWLTDAVLDVSWLPDLGLRLHLGVDGISAPLILLTALVGVLVTGHAFSDLPSGGAPATFIGSLLLVEAGALATFCARDAILFFVAFELVLVPMWVLISRFGDAHDARARSEAGHRFILYTALGSTLMLIGILLLVGSAGTSQFDELVERGAGLPTGVQVGVAVLLTVGLSVKVPVFPLHSWLPAAHTTAPTAGSVLLAAILLKMGSYGLVRLPLASVPDGFAFVAPALGIAGAVGIVWGGLICLVERDLKRLIAYSSVAHMGFVVLAMATGSQLGLQAALIGNIAHGLVSALLFVVVGGLKQRWGSVDLAVLRPALRDTAPHRGFALVLGLAAALGVPGLAVFWGEFLAIVASWTPGEGRPLVLFRILAVVAALGAVLGVAYCLRVAGRVWVGGPVPDEPGEVVDVETRGAERVVVTALALAVLAVGIVPALVLDVTGPAVTALFGTGR